MHSEMQIWINDQSVALTDSLNLSEVLTQQGLDHGCFVAVVNDTVVPKTTLEQRLIQPGDRIEILSPISGG
jgi:sulfur carrier protein